MTLISYLLYSLVILLSIISKCSSAPYFWNYYCPNTTMFANNSKYEINLNTVFHSLTANSTNSPGGFHATLVGSGTSDEVYGQFLCRGDQTASSCNDCVTTATTKDLPKTYCPNRKVAIIWYDECLVRYSNESLFGIMDQAPSFELLNSQNITGNVTQFTDILGTMLNKVTLRAANGGPVKKYATDIAAYTSLETMYGLVQCTPDLSASDCNQCLKIAIGIVPISRGGRTYAPSCYLRYEIYPFFNGAANLTLPPPPPPPSSSSSPPSPSNQTGTVPVSNHPRGKRRISTEVIAIVVTTVVLLVALLLGIMLIFVIKKDRTLDVAHGIGDSFTTVESLEYSLSVLQTATNNFSEENKLGEGGFGSVYKGTVNGQEIAVKRLSKSSGQGAEEFKNEVLLLAKLQHRNLVRLLGFCLDSGEQLLVYEYVPNKSLDTFIFDPIEQGQINWGMRHNIIKGIARGMLYLHHDSRHTIIHRDLKASNILLDENMNPKISDFGMARIFAGDQSKINTNRIVGTYGYMSPEYAMHGQFSLKSDVYSFGVLVLEIISGKKNTTFNESGYAEDLLSYAWKLWRDGMPLMFVDPLISDPVSSNEVVRCLQLGLLCVQDSIEARPTIATVVLSFESQTVTLPVPGEPAFFCRTMGELTMNSEKGVGRSSDNSVTSVNDVSVSEMEPR